MDFKSATAEDVLAAIPLDEDDRWEIKSAMLLDPKKKSELIGEIGKQTSAFGNSGGGNLVFGISKTRDLEECPALAGTTSMKDHLTNLIEQHVEYPMRHFRVHPCPFAKDKEKRIYVIEYEDSPAAPHQSKADKHYYYRLDGQSKPAPHFHVELLRNRFTKSALSIRAIDLGFEAVELMSGHLYQLHLRLRIDVENISHQATTNWAVLLDTARTDHRWRVPSIESRGEVSREITGGLCVPSQSPVIFPKETQRLDVPVRGFDRSNHIEAMHAFSDIFRSIAIIARPVSQNHVGEAVLHSPANDYQAVREFERRVEYSLHPPPA